MELLASLRTRVHRENGVWVVRDSGPPVGITAQFLADAQTWAAAHCDPSYWRWLVERCLTHVQLPRSPRVLEVGCGSGDGTLAMLDVLPDSQVLASDVSPQMLAILESRLTDARRNRLTLVCADAMTLEYVNESFDFAFGASILHHLMQPELLLRRVQEALRPGAYAIFLEPYEGGNVALRLLCEHILREADSLGVGDAMQSMLREVAHDVEVRTECSKSAPIFQTLDDKWMFTPSRFERLGRAAGFCECRSFTTREPQNLFRDYMAMFLRLKCGLTPQSLPPGAWDIVAYYDRIFSDDLKNDIMMDGGVVFRK